MGLSTFGSHSTKPLDKMTKSIERKSRKRVIVSESNKVFFINHYTYQFLINFQSYSEYKIISSTSVSTVSQIFLDFGLIFSQSAS